MNVIDKLYNKAVKNESIVQILPGLSCDCFVWNG